MLEIMISCLAPVLATSLAEEVTPFMAEVGDTFPESDMQVQASRQVIGLKKQG